LWRKLEGRDGRRLTTAVFRKWWQSAVERCGMDPHRATPHGLRRGAATAAALLGFPDYVLARLGRWSALRAASHLYTILPRHATAFLRVQLVFAAVTDRPSYVRGRMLKEDDPKGFAPVELLEDVGDVD
jgi:integrase